jgi:hypothetical protein
MLPAAFAIGPRIAVRLPSGSLGRARACITSSRPFSPRSKIWAGAAAGRRAAGAGEAGKRHYDRVRTTLRAE